MKRHKWSDINARIKPATRARIEAEGRRLSDDLHLSELRKARGLTQETMAQMIGARRNSVSLVASMLQQANFIHYSRGHIEITNIEGLKRTACECYASVKAQYDRLLVPPGGAEIMPRSRVS